MFEIIILGIYAKFQRFIKTNIQTQEIHHKSGQIIILCLTQITWNNEISESWDLKAGGNWRSKRTLRNTGSNPSCLEGPMILRLVGGWTNPSEKYARQIGSFSPGKDWK